MIVDCFPFFNELDVLEIRLNELKDIVDFHVLVEATRTFSNHPKPLYFEENKERFAGFPIKHFVMDDFSGVDLNGYDGERQRRMAMDYGQKQWGLDRLLAMDLPGEVLVVLTDCDEIPRGDVVARIAAMPVEIAQPLKDVFYYYLNCLDVTTSPCPAGKLVRMREIHDEWHCNFRTLREARNIMSVSPKGWHFSYTTDIPTKLAAYAHSEYDGLPFNDPKHIERCKTQGRDLFFREHQYKFLGTDHLPRYVQKNLERFGHLIHP